MSGNYHELVVSEVITETDDAASFILEVPPEQNDLFRYRSGQFLTIKALTEEGELDRCYSLSSVDGQDKHLKITVKRVPFGPVSNWMLDKVRKGDTLAVMRPAGMFVSRDSEMDLGLFSAGSGITPIISIAKQRLMSASGAHVSLFYANRNEHSIIFREELNELAGRFPDRFSIVHWLETVQGLPGPRLLAGHARTLGSREYFVCGPAPFMDAVAMALDQLGVDKHQVHLERFVFAPAKQPVTSVPPKPQGQSSEQVANAMIEVTLDGKSHTVAWKDGELMLDALQAAGLNPPYSCRAGSCGACICQLNSGEVDMLQNQLLDEADLAEGLILACQAVARSPVVKVTF